MRLLLILLPWLELFTLIQLGISTSALVAIAWVFLGVVLGMALLRRQGMGLMEQMQRGYQLSPQLLMDDMAVGFAALLLMVPGLITDFAALIVLIGPVRRRLAAWLRPSAPENPDVQPPTSGPQTIEGEFRRVD